MELKNTLFAVRDLKASLRFYENLLGLEVVSDFGENVVLTGGLSLQTLESWAGFLGKAPEDVAFGGNNAEIYFETADLDDFLGQLKDHTEVELVCPPLEHRWGQRVVRLYDPDRHIVEVAEPLGVVCKRFLDSGLNEEGIARRMDIPIELVRACLKQERA